MSPPGALLVALISILVLGAFAGWLMNVPMWVIGVGLVAGGLVIRRIFRRIAQARARQETEAPK